MVQASPNEILSTYAIPAGTVQGVSWYPNGPKQLADLIRLIWLASPIPGCLSLPLPRGIKFPSCGDPAFRIFSSKLRKLSPGLSFFVLGGDSPLAREIFLTSLPNARAACLNGRIAIQYSVEEAQIVFMEACERMIDVGIAKAAALQVIGRLAAQSGMEASHWR